MVIFVVFVVLFVSFRFAALRQVKVPTWQMHGQLFVDHVLTVKNKELKNTILFHFNLEAV